MTDDFITIREATRLTEKSDITIRRLIKHLLKQNDPQISQMIRQEKTKGGFVYKINKNFLLEKLKLEPLKVEIEEAKEISEEIETKDIIREVLKTLKTQLEIKDRQIESLSKKIDELIERDRETNIIIKTLQDKIFMLEAGRQGGETKKNEEKREDEKRENT